MESVKVGQQSLLGYLPAILIKNVLDGRIKKDSPPPVGLDMTTVSLFADISGFTKLSESFSKKGRTGSEFLAFCLNRYMELLINIIGKNGGDIFKFAGDALLVIWPEEKNGDFSTTCRRALQCALSIQSKLNNLEMSKGKVLSVKVGLGFGKCKVLLVGGKFNRFECLVVGEAMRQACTSECHCKAGGQIVVSEDVYSQISQFYDFEEAEPDTEHGPGDGLKYYKFIGSNKGDKIQVRADAFLMRSRFNLSELKVKLPQLKTFVPAAITIYLDIEKEAWCKESRLVTIMFLNLTIDLKHTKSEDGLQYIQKIIKTVQCCVYRTRGSLNKFLMDDKGSVLLIAWGIPPISAHDDPIRAVLTGLNIINELKNLQNEKWGNCGAKIGITTGCCFSGVCGNIGNRREYSLLGEVVNLSARYMQQAMSMCAKENKKYQIVLCENTKNLIQDKIFCKWVAKGKCKGFSNEFNFYVPVENEEGATILTKIIKTRRDNPKLDDEGNVIPDLFNDSLFIVGRDKEIKQCLSLMTAVCTSDDSKMVLIRGIIGSGKSLFVRRVLIEYFEQNKRLKMELPENKKNLFPFLFVTRQLPTMSTTPYNGCCDFLQKMFNAITMRGFEKNKTFKLKCGVEVKTNEFGEILIANNYFGFLNYINEILEADILSQHFDFPENQRKKIEDSFIQFDQPNLDKYFTKRNLKAYCGELNKCFIKIIEFYIKKFIPNLPLILVIEDTHLIDHYSMQLVNFIHSLPRTFIICTYQDSLNPYVKQEPPYFDYDELYEFQGFRNIRDILKLISNFCKKSKKIYIKDIEKDALHAISEHSFKNNPLFIIEIVDSLLDQNELVISNGTLSSSPAFRKRCKLMDWSKLNIPFLLEKIVGNIIDSLKCTQIITLKHACVIGAIFDIDKLNHLNIFNSITFEDLVNMLYEFREKGLIEILYDINPKRLVAKFSIPFLKEILYKRMLVETKNEIHLKVAQLMESPKFTYLPKDLEKELLDFHLMEEEKTILDHMDDSKDKEEQKIVKEANLRIRVIKESIDRLKEIQHGDEKEESNYVNGIESKKSMPIIKCGTIDKKSDKGITWEPRFVIATKTKFYYWYTSEDYIQNKQYLGMFELKNIYDITILRDFEFSDKKNLIEVKVSSYYKKDILKGGRGYIFSVKTKPDLTAWVVALNFLRAKAIYDEFRGNFGTLNFPLNHEKVIDDNKKKEKRKFDFKEVKSSSNQNQSLTKGVSRKKTEKKNSVFLLNQSTLNIEKKEEIESERIQRMKARVEPLISTTFGFLVGLVQEGVVRKQFVEENNDDEFELPRHLKMYTKHKFYKLIEEEYETNKNKEEGSEEIEKKVIDEKIVEEVKREENIANGTERSRSEESNTQNNSDGDNLKSLIGGGGNVSTNNNNQQQPMNYSNGGAELDAKDKLQALSGITLKNDILDEQIKMMILGKK